MTHNGKILLVEDNPDDVELTLRALNQQNLANDVVVMRDGAEALEYLLGSQQDRGSPPNGLPVVMLLDLNLPKVSGLEVLQRVREQDVTKHMPVVILTSSREDQDVIDSYDLGANSFVQKPVDFERFMEAVRQLGMYWLLLNEAPRDATR